MLQFRDFKEGDETQLVSLVMELKKFYPSIERWLTKEITKLKNKEDECIVVEVDGEIAGCAISGIESNGVYTAKLKTFYIKEKYRRLSFGPYLLNRVLDYWTEKGYKRIFVTFAEEDVDELLNYFREYGFLLDGVFPFNYRQDKAEYYMSKMNVYLSIDKNNFQSFVADYLFRLRGYNVSSIKSRQFVVQKHVYTKEAYKTLVYLNFEENIDKNTLIKKLRELIRDNNCSTGIIVSYHYLSSLNENSIKVIDNYDLETMFFPLNIQKDEHAGFISPIQKLYADRILYAGTQTQLLSDKISIRKEKVFYKFPNIPNIKGGQTFLFYESEPTSAIIGEGKVKEFVIDKPEKIFERFNAKGVLSLEEIKGYADKKGSVLAISIGKFVRYKNKVSLDKIREIKKGFNPQGSSMVTEEELKEIRKKAKYPYIF